MGKISREEFLDMDNIVILREVRDSMDYVKRSALISAKLVEAQKKISLCDIVRSESPGFKPRYHYESLFLDMLAMYVSGDLVVKKPSCHPIGQLLNTYIINNHGDLINLKDLDSSDGDKHIWISKLNEAIEKQKTL